MRILKPSALILLLAVASFPGLALSQELPDTAALSARLALELPSYWKVDGFTIIAQAKEGDVRTPLAIVRYEANVHNSAQLFKNSSQRVGPFSVIVPTLEQRTSRTLFGIMELSYTAGSWAGLVDIENPVGELGQPVDLFLDPVVVLGSTKLQQITDLMATSEVTALVNELQNQLAETRLQNEKQIADMQVEHEVNLIEIEKSQNEEIAILSSGNQPELEQLRNQAEVAHRGLVQEYQNELAELQSEQAENLAKIRAEQAGEVRELEVGFATRIASLKSQIDESHELAALQERFMRMLEQQAVNYSRITELHANALQEKPNIMQSYLGQWTGFLNCRNNQWQVRFMAEKIEGQSVSGTIDYTSGETTSYPASLNILNSDLSRPTPATLIPTGGDDLYTYEGEIGQDGTLRGNYTRDSRCKIVLSQ